MAAGVRCFFAEKGTLRGFDHVTFDEPFVVEKTGFFEVHLDEANRTMTMTPIEIDEATAIAERVPHILVQETCFCAMCGEYHWGEAGHQPPSREEIEAEVAAFRAAFSKPEPGPGQRE